MFVSRKTALPGVRAIAIFAAESHPWIRQPALQNGQRIDEAVASFHGLLRERLQNDRIALSIRFKTRMGGSLHEFCRNQNFAPVINLDNHRETPTVNYSPVIRKLGGLTRSIPVGATDSARPGERAVP